MNKSFKKIQISLRTYSFQNISFSLWTYNENILHIYICMYYYQVMLTGWISFYSFPVKIYQGMKQTQKFLFSNYSLYNDKRKIAYNLYNHRFIRYQIRTDIVGIIIFKIKSKMYQFT